MADTSEAPSPDADPAATPPGSTPDAPLLFGRYRVERELGRGGMGRVLLAFDTKLRIHVAVKLVPDQLMADAEAADDLRREVLRGMALMHPAIVRTHNFEQDETGAAIVMEYIDGLTFTEWKTQQPGHCFDCDQLLPWLGPLCEVLDYAHREARIVHRDLKPRNIMISQEGKLKVADFGIAATLTDSHSRLTGHANMSGTPAYMSPQQARGKKPSHLDDVYSLGATIYDLIAGKPPFFRGSGETILMQVVGESAPTMAERREELFISGKAPTPEHWEQTIAACLAKDPAERPQSCGEVLARLLTPTPAPEPVPAPQPLKPKNVVPPEPVKKPMARVAPPRPTVPLPSTPPPKRHSTWLAPASAVLVIGLALGAWWFVQGRKPAHVTSPVASKPASAAPRTEAASPKAETTPPPAPLVAKTATPQPPKPTPASITPTPATPKPLTEIDKWLAQVEAIYQPKWQNEVIAPYETGLYELKKNTLIALDTQIANASRAAKLNDALAFRNDRQRIESDADIPADDSDGPPAALKLLRVTWRTQSARLETDRRQHAQTLFTQYDQVLATNQAALTQRQRLDEALQLQQRRDALKAEWLAPPPKRGTPAAATKERPFVNSLGMKFVPVPGTGGPTNGQRVLFSIWVTRVQDYEQYALANPDADGAWRTQEKNGVPVGREPNHPVVSVSWEDAQAFCKWLTDRERSAGRIQSDASYRLPTDEEWSKAVGLPPETGMTPEEQSDKNSDEFPWGSTWPPIRAVGNFADEVFHAKFPPTAGDPSKWLENYNDGYATTSPVGSFAPNELGLYDMSGNVWEWCDDWWNNERRDRVLRSARWIDCVRPALLSSHRTHYPPSKRLNYAGFRCVFVVRASDKSASAASSVVAPAPATTPVPLPTPRVPTTSGSTPRPVGSAPRLPGASSTASGALALQKATKDAPFVNSLGMKFVPVPGTKVLFCIHETRNKDFATYVADTPILSRDWQHRTEAFASLERGEEHPVVLVNFERARAFCAWLSAKEGYVYRLPTDKEWSYAAGIGAKEKWSANTTPEMRSKTSVPNEWPWGNQWPPPDGAGNFGQGSIGGYTDRYASTAPVMSFKANKLGIFDLSANIAEMCEDWFNDDRNLRVTRGEGWGGGDRNRLLSSYRRGNDQNNQTDWIGFRCAVELPGQ